MIHFDRIGFGDRCSRFTGRGNDTVGEPENLSFKMVSREWDSASGSIGVERFPADLHPGKPEPSCTREQDFLVGLRFVMVTQRRYCRGRSGPRFGRMLLREDTERPPRPGFEQDWVVGLPERLKCVVKACGMIR